MDQAYSGYNLATVVRISPAAIEIEWTAKGSSNLAWPSDIQFDCSALKNWSALRETLERMIKSWLSHCTFLYCPGVAATHWRAEQAIRPMGVTRKVWGGNRAATGAQAQSILLRILQTCRQQNRPVLPLLQRLLCSPRPRVLDLTPPRRLSR